MNQLILFATETARETTEKTVETPVIIESLILGEYRELARRAHNWTSFSPEKRGDSLIIEFSEQLNADIELLKSKEVPQETIDGYIDRYKSLFSSWLYAKSNCISSMITGPAKFPTRRAEKANNSEHNKYTAFQQWRIKAQKAIMRRAEPEKTIETEIERYTKDLNDRKATQEYCKRINAAYRAYKSNPTPETLAKLELSEKEQNFIITFVPAYSFQPMPFPGYVLSNNLANIKRIEDCIAKLENKAVKAEDGDKVFNFDGFDIEYSYADNRIRIKHDTKPTPEIISLLKKKAFKWSPSAKAWQRFLTNDSVYAIQEMFKITLPKI